MRNIILINQLRFLSPSMTIKRKQMGLINKNNKDLGWSPGLEFKEGLFMF